MNQRKRPARYEGDPLAEFAGHVPDRSRLDADIRVVNEAEFLTRLEPRTDGKAKSVRAGESTEHGTRMKLLALERERRAEKATSIGVLADADGESE